MEGWVIGLGPAKAPKQPNGTFFWVLQPTKSLENMQFLCEHVGT